MQKGVAFLAQKYIAFISYRHAELDSAIAKSLHSLIEQYRIPRGVQKTGKKRLGVVFRDQEELHAASDLSHEIQSALNSTEYLIVVCSKNSVESPWVTREVDHFLQNHDRSQVFTVLASGEPMEVFPPQLTMTPEGEPIEPLAVDVRADTISGCRKKLRKELPRLIAAMLRCPYDALVMREQKRKTRRIAGIAAGAMAILLGFTSMVLLKNNQIELANNQLEIKNVELNQANVALEEQKAAVQLRESQLLVQSALEDLDNADYYSAMQKAVDALPADESDNRPYYAPAEQVLMDALGTFRTADDDEILNTTILEQVTDIESFVITQDGTRVMTTDEFGTVFCFDAESGQQLWHQYAMQESSGSPTTYYLFLGSNDQILIRTGKQTLSAYDVETGTPLWTQSADSIAADYLFYNQSRNTLVFVNSYSAENFINVYELVEVDVESGEILNQIHLADNTTNYIYSFSGYSSSGLSKNGHFYNDGTRFCGAFFDSNHYLHCFDADLTQGTCHIFYTSAEPMLSGADPAAVFRDADNAMYVVCANAKENYLLSVLKIDMSTGNPIWEQDIEEPDSFSLLLTKNTLALGFNGGILVGCGNNFFLLEALNGNLLTTKAMPSDIVSMCFVSSSNFGFSLDDGTYGIGWISTANETITLTTDSDWQSFVDLEPHEQLQVWGGGIVQLYTEGSKFWLGIGNFASPGSVLLIPKQQENTLQIVRPVQALTENNLEFLQIPEEDFMLYSDATASKVGDLLAIGEFYKSSDSGKAYMFLDPATQQIIEAYNYTDYYSKGSLFWIPGTRQPLVCSNYDPIMLINDDGTKTELYNADTVQDELGEKNGYFSSISLFRSASAYLTKDGSVLTATCNPEYLQWWKNGEPMGQTDLPAELMVDPKESFNKERIIEIGANGYILVSLHDYQDAIPLENIMVYNPDADSWTSFQSDAIFSNADSIVFAKEKAWMAGADQNGVVRILDLTTGNTVGRFATQLPSGSVLQMQFFLDDTHLAIKAAGGHLLIYEVESGTLVYRDQLSDAYSSTLQVFEDPDHNRLYLHCGSGSGLCLDLDSWTTLANLKNLLYYDSSTNTIYLRNTSYDSGSPIAYGTVPDTMELIRKANELLANT